MIGGAKGIGIGIDFGIPNQYCRATSKPYIEKDVLDSLRVVASAYGKSNNDADRSIVKNLVDASNPFVISNAAYDKMSSYGGYEFAKFDNTTEWDLFTSDSIDIISRNGYSVTLKSKGGSSFYGFRNIRTKGFQSNDIPFKVRANKSVIIMWDVYGNAISDGQFFGRTIMSTTLNPDQDATISLKHMTEEELNELGMNKDGMYYGIWFDLSTLAVDEEVTIEMLPLFEGAFVTDGVDDLITSTKTVQEMLGGSNELTIVSMVHQVKDSANNVSFTNYIRGSANGYFRNIVNNYDKTGIYGYTSSDLKGLSVVNNILGDNECYTSNGDNRDSIINGNFSVQGYSYNDGNNTGDFSSVAWYWTIIANKVLTTDQINQVIAYFNLDRTLKPDILCDVKKQGITNENHAEFGDRLIDFSGNGRDIQLNNIAWKGDSGIGKYETDFTKWLLDQVVDITIKYSSFNIKTKNDSRVNSWVVRVQDTVAPSMKIKVTGISSSVESLIYRYSIVGDTYYYIDITSDGIYELPQTDGKSWEGFRVIGKNFNISVEQIPSHAGALCLDGVDDFGINKDVPTFTDFTVIAKRTWLEENTSDKPFIIKGDSLYPDGNQNAFLFEYGKLSTYSFGQNNKYDESVVPSLISYATTYSYNGVIPLVRGSATDTIGIDVAHSTKIALYFLMLFPYSMSEFLIERQLKKHKLGTLYPDMMEFRPIVKSNLPYSSISYSVNPGEYISVDSMVTITVTLPNTSDELMEVSCNAISDISISGDNGVYEITGKIVKSPQKINLVISSYLTMLNNETLISNETLIKNE